MNTPRPAWLGLLTVACLTLCSASAQAFCGFYVAGADSSLFNDATMVVLMRDGTRTVLSMRNDYVGPPEAFAMVVPVPVVLDKEQVKTLPHEVFSRVDALGAPRLVEYWEQDPCAKGARDDAFAPSGATGQGFGSGSGRLGGAGVRIEARFEVGEYEVVILSADDSSGLDRWLRDQGYQIPPGAEPHLRPYVARGSKFFVAKVNPDKVDFKDGRARLSPLRFHFDSERFDLPIKLGLINSQGKQDLIVNVLARDRYQVANYPNATIPTNLDVFVETRDRFGELYELLFEATLERTPKAVVTEYAWAAKTCDPCPQAPLSDQDLLTLGADALPSIDPSKARGRSVSRVSTQPPRLSGQGKLPPEVVQRIVRQNFGRFRLCHGRAMKVDPDATGNVAVRFGIDAAGKIGKPSIVGSAPTWGECVRNAFESLAFPAPEGGPVVVDLTVGFTTGTARGSSASSFARDLVLTRLHARYGPDTVGEDLVFEKADPIVGGRESARDGKMERGAKPSSVNMFQARYAIRHAWKGKIECEEPRRGRWGGPPGGFGDAATLSATNFGVAKGGAKLDDLVPGDPFASSTTLPKPPTSPSSAPATTAAPAASSTEATPPGPTGCGCEIAVGSPNRGAEHWLALLLAGCALSRIFNQPDGPRRRMKCGPKNRSRSLAVPTHRARADSQEPAQVHLQGRADRAKGQGQGVHPRPPDRHPTLSLQRSATGGRRPGRRRGWR
jgi:hypothetical protein